MSVSKQHINYDRFIEPAKDVHRPWQIEQGAPRGVLAKAFRFENDVSDRWLIVGSGHNNLIGSMLILVGAARATTLSSVGYSFSAREGLEFSYERLSSEPVQTVVETLAATVLVYAGAKMKENSNLAEQELALRELELIPAPDGDA